MKKKMSIEFADAENGLNSVATQMFVLLMQRSIVYVRTILKIVSLRNQ